MEAHPKRFGARQWSRGKIAHGRLRAGKAETIRHKGKKLKDILDAHEKFHKGYPGGERADLSGADLPARI